MAKNKNALFALGYSDYNYGGDVDMISKVAKIDNKLNELEGDVKKSSQGSNEYVDEKIDELVNGAPEALDTLKEIADKIESMNITEIEELLNSKANISDLTTHTNNSSIHVTSADKTNWNAVSNKANAADVYTKTEANDAFQPKGNYATVSDLEAKADVSALDAYATVEALNSKADASSLDAYATVEALNAKANASDVYTKAQADETFQPKGDYITEHQSLEDYAKKEDLDAKANVSDVYTKTQVDDEFQPKGEYLTQESLSGYASESFVETKVGDLVNGAPEALDTLKELADKLTSGDDAIINLINRVTAIERYISGIDGGTEINNQVVEDALVNQKNVVIPNGEVSEINVPQTTEIKSVSANLADETSVNLTSPKNVNIVNLSSGTVQTMTIEAPASTATTTVNLSANCETVIVKNASVQVASGYTVQNIIIQTEGEDETNSVTVNANFAENASITYDGSNPMTIGNKNAQDDLANLTIDAENSTVTLNGSWESVDSTVGDDTLIVGPSAHIKTLTVKKGNVIVKDIDVANRIDNVVNDTEYTVSCYEMNATTTAEFRSMALTNGITNVQTDIDGTPRLTFGTFASGNYRWNLNGHNLKVGDANFGVLTRGSAVLNIYGDGKLYNEASYCLWASANSTINVYGGEYIGLTHTVYLESANAEINIYGGTFKSFGGDKDENGNYKFLVNYLDKVWDANNKRIHIYGGKFYEFNPAVSYGEPNGPVNLLEDGYHVVETTEDGVKVYEVVKD